MAVLDPLFIDAALGLVECEDILGASKALRWQRPSPVGALLSSRSGVVTWLDLDCNPSLKKKIDGLFERANLTFKFDILGIEPQVQLTRYKNGDGLDWHHDCNLNASHALRKLTLSILLNDAQSFSGGDLEIQGGDSQGFTQQQGTAVVFPSFLQHRVCCVKKGQRVSLVTWALGAAFR